MALRVFADVEIPRIPGQPGRSVGDEAEQLIRERFAAHGIVVVDEKFAPARLNVSIYFSCGADGSACGHHTRFALEQWVVLKADPHSSVAAVTWANSYTGGVTRNELPTLPDALMLNVGSLLEGFVTQYREANP